MYKLYYILKDSGVYLLRNKTTFFLRSIFALLYTLTLRTFLHAWIFSVKFEAVEKQKAIEQKTSLESIVQTNSSDHLITLVVSLKIGFIIFSVGLFLFGIAYLFIHFQNILLLEKKELITKKMLGSSTIGVTSELFFDSVLLIVPGIILGIITASCLYTKFFYSSNSWLKTILNQPSYLFLHVDIPLIGLFSLLFGCLFLYLKHKISNL